MYFGGPNFVLAIIAMVMFAGIMKTAIRAKHGGFDRRGRGRGEQPDAGEIAQIADLRAQNARLSDRLEAYEDRLIVLEKIVTDSGYDLAHQIEALRDKPARIEQERR